MATLFYLDLYVLTEAVLRRDRFVPLHASPRTLCIRSTVILVDGISEHRWYQFMKFTVDYSARKCVQNQAIILGTLRTWVQAGGGMQLTVLTAGDSRTTPRPSITPLLASCMKYSHARFQRIQGCY